MFTSRTEMFWCNFNFPLNVNTFPIQVVIEQNTIVIRPQPIIKSCEPEDIKKFKHIKAMCSRTGSIG